MFFTSPGSEQSFRENTVGKDEVFPDGNKLDWNQETWLCVLDLPVLCCVALSKPLFISVFFFVFWKLYFESGIVWGDTLSVIYLLWLHSGQKDPSKS